METWDLYDENRRLTGETMVRGEKAPAGRYHLIVDMLFLNSRGETLLQRKGGRGERKTYPKAQGGEHGSLHGCSS